jgi:hypothetical protein
MDDPRIGLYETRHNCQLLGPIGPGTGQDGFVRRSDRSTVVKFFDRPQRFERELEVYRILQAKGIFSIAGHAVPELTDADKEFLAIEMTIVDRPFVLDFAGAKLPSEIPDFEPEVMEEHYESLRELFGDRWSDALHIAAMFRRETGFELLDIHPGNIAFADP